MKIPVSWLNDYVKVDDLTIDELKDKLLNIGFEVEDVIYLGEGIENVVTAKITKITKHPNADKLQICDMDCGEKGNFVIITAATNVFEGAIVPAALVGAKLVGGINIGQVTFKGVVSDGMLCSGKELGIDGSFVDGGDVDGILILDKDMPVGVDIVKALELDEYILDVSVTANRPDCQSVYGMARETAAALGRPLLPLVLDYETENFEYKNTGIKISASEDCPIYMGSTIKNVKIEPSPKWMRKRLTMVGVRPISNLVDITNYVLMEVGQPLHAFDLDKLNGDIEVRRANKGEVLTALNGENYTLDENTLLIADQSGGLAIAGVMGGKDSGVSQETKNIFLETARFAKGRVRYASRMLGLRSESSARYEKGVDFNCVYTGRERALSLIYELGAGTVAQNFIKAGSGHFEKTIVTNLDKINALLGICVEKRAVLDILTRLGFDVNCSGKMLEIKVPLFREDVDNYTDICEEIIRFYGYDKLEETFLKNAAVTEGGYTPRQKKIEVAKQIMLANGFYESMSFSFIGKKECSLVGADAEQLIKIKNPLSEDYAYMRNTLVPSVLVTAKTNLIRSNKEFRLFEVSTLFKAKALPLTELPEERVALCAVVSAGDFYSVKGVAEEIAQQFSKNFELKRANLPYLHPGISATIVIDGVDAINFGKIHPTVMEKLGVKQELFIIEVDLEYLVGLEDVKKKYQPLNKLPDIQRDLAVTVKEEIEVGALMDAIVTADEKIVKANLFDIYRGEQIEKGYKSVALSFDIRPGEKSLTDNEINGIMDKALGALENLGAVLRK
ncbi:MAG: phenylalanine--tRNA ligase subunit beta [Clostridia bacterium]|nr:phenylalanine--tRNA ligase subunit beta [Clostridia bacterium]